MTPGPQRSAAAPRVEISVASRSWNAARGIRASIRKAIVTAAAHAPAPQTEVAVLLTDDAAIRAINHEWRGKDQATNVLSFPAPASPQAGAELRPLGDIVIAFETTTREAAAEGKPFENHVSHLAVHGFLHLMGYDHETTQEAEEMEGLERAILARLGIPDPYPAGPND